MAIDAATAPINWTGAVIIPVLVAGLTAAATMTIGRIGEAANRRRDRYAEAVETLVAWIEFPYRVRRRTDDEPSTLAALASLGHDLQERLACHQTWIVTESSAVADEYAQVRELIASVVGPAISDAWRSPPVKSADQMILQGWGPGDVCNDALANLQEAVRRRFGIRRLSRPLRSPR